MAGDASLQDNNRPSIAHDGLPTSTDNPRRKWRPWACHVPYYGRSFATSHDLATHLARYRSPGGNEDAYIGSLVILYRKARITTRKNSCVKPTIQSANGILEFESAKSQAEKEDVHLFEAEVAEIRAGIGKVQQGIGNTQASA